MVEYMELDSTRKWEYLQRYYQVASEFYGVGDTIVTDEEIDACIRRFKERPTPKHRRQIALKQWKFRLDADDEGIEREYYASGYDDSQWEDVKTPHSCRFIPEQPLRFGRLDCNLVKTEALWQATYDAWYRTQVPLAPLKQNETAYLSFESVNHISTVWLNENPVMLDHLGLFPYKVDVGDELHRQASDRVTVAVRARNVVSNHPNLFYNGWQFAYRNPPYTGGARSEDWRDQADAGIAGEAQLQVVNVNHLEDVFLYTHDIAGDDASLVCQVTLRNAARERFHGCVRVEISSWLPEESPVVQTVTKLIETLPMSETRLELPFRMVRARLWSVDSPSLYLAHIILEDAEGQPIDDLYETFGVRTIEMVGSSFYLNNQRIVPRGTHDVAIYHGESDICPSDRIIVKDILLHKKMGAICSRWPSDKSMQYRRLADYCDQLGFMLSWCGYLQIWTVHPDLEMLARRDVKAMVRALRNCPSLVIWEMGDEPLMYEHSFRRFSWYELIYRLVSDEDRTRPILPAGDWCRDLLELITSRSKAEASVDVARAKVLADYPVYRSELAGWDYHHCPHGEPLLPAIDRIKNALGGDKPTVFTEFGVHALPELSKVMDVYGRFRWASSPLFGIKEGQQAYARFFYGREIGPEDWRETQACQAAILQTIIGRLRQYPKEFAAYHLVTMFDAWTFYWGVVDVHGNAKLGYFVARSCYQPVYISGLHGDTILRPGEEIEITASNYGEALADASLQVRIVDGSGRVLREQAFDGLTIPGEVAVTTVGRLQMVGLGPDLYSVEYRLSARTGSEAARTVELFFLESQA